MVLLILTTPLYAQNYDESKVGNYLLPELLTTQTGKKINSAKEWEQSRRRKS